MNSVQKDHAHRISKLTNQLDSAKNKINSLENIIVSTEMGKENGSV